MRLQFYRIAALMALAYLGMAASAMDAWNTEDFLHASALGGDGMTLLTSLDKGLTIDDQSIQKVVKAQVLGTGIHQLGMSSSSSLTIADGDHLWSYGYGFSDSIRPRDCSARKDLNYQLSVQYSLQVDRSNLDEPVMDSLSVFKFHDPGSEDGDLGPIMRLGISSKMSEDQIFEEIDRSIQEMKEQSDSAQLKALPDSDLVIRFSAPGSESHNGVTCIWTKDYEIDIPLTA
jgi:hypothetical protein